MVLLQQLSTAVLISLAANVLAAGSPSFVPEQSQGEREKILMDFDWKFHLGDAPDVGTNLDYPEVKDLAKTQVRDVGLEGELANVADAVTKNLGANISFVQNNFDDNKWRQLDLPHDWAVELPFVTNGVVSGTTSDLNEINNTVDQKSLLNHGFKPVGPGFSQSNVGWYRKEFDLPADDKGKTLWLDFDGIFRNSLVWLNGHCLGRHLSGYSSFRYDISQFANYGGRNEVVVRVDASKYEGWFYEGAGIYRHVWLEKTSPIAVAPDGIFVWSEFENDDLNRICHVHVQTSVQCQGSVTNFFEFYRTRYELFDPKGSLVGSVEQTNEASMAKINAIVS
ncbi:MAG TPA: hypothetical protein VN516_05360, partial [Candidatus Baltobacteraceae bacterium]|nr:hypothetical protein [Candidatus Baltobacteraceae bacterium]